MAKPGRAIRTLLFSPKELSLLHTKNTPSIVEDVEDRPPVESIHCPTDGLVPLFDLSGVS